MILTLTLAVVLSVLLVWFVLAPLFSTSNMEVFSASHKGFADENELGQVLKMRDQLIERLVIGKTQDDRLAQLNESECFDALLSLCLRLQRAELPYLPAQQASVSDTFKTQGGFVRLSLMGWIALLGLLVGVMVAVPSAFGMPGMGTPGQSSQTATGNSQDKKAVVESLHILEPDVLLPTSNRYIVSPAEAEVVAHHVSLFTVSASQMNPFTVVMAVPENIYDWQIVEVKPESLSKLLKVSNWNGLPAVQFPAGTQGLAVSLSSEFRLSAKTGRAAWKNDKLSGFPGEQVVVAFEIPSIMRQLLSGFASGWNIWPPRIVRPGLGTQLLEREVPMGPDAPVRRVQLVSRSDESTLPFVAFEIVGIVPSRMPLMLLGALVGAVLFGVALALLSRKNSLEN